MSPSKPAAGAIRTSDGKFFLHNNTPAQINFREDAYRYLIDREGRTYPIDDPFEYVDYIEKPDNWHTYDDPRQSSASFAPPIRSANSEENTTPSVGTSD